MVNPKKQTLSTTLITSFSVLNQLIISVDISVVSLHLILVSFFSQSSLTFSIMACKIFAFSTVLSVEYRLLMFLPSVLSSSSNPAGLNIPVYSAYAFYLQWVNLFFLECTPPLSINSNFKVIAANMKQNRTGILKIKTNSTIIH